MKKKMKIFIAILIATLMLNPTCVMAKDVTKTVTSNEIKIDGENTKINFRVYDDKSVEWTIDGNSYHGSNNVVQLIDSKTNISIDSHLKDKVAKAKETVAVATCETRTSDGNTKLVFTTDVKYCDKNATTTAAKKETKETVKKTTNKVENNVVNVADDMTKENKGLCGTNSEAIFGDPNNEKSLAWLIIKILNYSKVLAPILVLVLSSLDFAKALISSDDDTMKKAYKKLITRLVLAAALFFVPTIVRVILAVFGLTNDPTCGLLD